MKKKFTIIFILILGFGLQSCKVTWDQYGNRVWLKKDSNNGEYEKYDLKIFFRTQYKKQSHPRYFGKITFTKGNDFTCVKFDSIPINISENANKYNLLFTSGLISAQMFISLKKDTNTICCFEELNYLKYPPTKKRFKFLVFEPTIFNPFVYLMELTNENANEKTDLETFIKDSKLTFFIQRGIQM